METIVQNPHILKSFELPSIDCSAGDAAAAAEERHRDAVQKIVNWSKNKDGQHKVEYFHAFHTSAKSFLV